MVRVTEIRKIAFIGDYLPRKCGIATFTSDLCRAVAGQYPSVDCTVGAVNDVVEGYAYPPEVRFEFSEQDLDSYRRAADFLNFSNADVICLQHEYGLYGGSAGRHILALLARPADADRDHTAYRAPRAHGRPSARNAWVGRSLVAAGRDVPAWSDLLNGHLRRARTED